MPCQARSGQFEGQLCLCGFARHAHLGLPGGDEVGGRSAASAPHCDGGVPGGLRSRHRNLHEPLGARLRGGLLRLRGRHGVCQATIDQLATSRGRRRRGGRGVQSRPGSSPEGEGDPDPRIHAADHPLWHDSNVRSHHERRQALGPRKRDIGLRHLDGSRSKSPLGLRRGGTRGPKESSRIPDHRVCRARTDDQREPRLLASTTGCEGVTIRLDACHLGVEPQERRQPLGAHRG